MSEQNQCVSKKKFQLSHRDLMQKSTNEQLPENKQQLAAAAMLFEKKFPNVYIGWLLSIKLYIKVATNLIKTAGNVAVVICCLVALFARVI